MWTSYSLLTDTYKLKYSIDYITTSTCYIGKSVNNYAQIVLTPVRLSNKN